MFRRRGVGWLALFGGKAERRNWGQSGDAQCEQEQEQCAQGARGSVSTIHPRSYEYTLCTFQRASRLNAGRRRPCRGGKRSERNERTDLALKEASTQNPSELWQATPSHAHPHLTISPPPSAHTPPKSPLDPPRPFPHHSSFGLTARTPMPLHV